MIGLQVKQIQTDISKWAMQLQFLLLSGLSRGWLGKMTKISSEIRDLIAREIELVDWLDYQTKDDIAEFIRGNA
jgi:hypothetical protein